MNKKSSSTKDKIDVQIPFVKQNYMFMAAGFLLVVLGFIVMYVGEDGRGKSEVIYSFSKTTLPVLLILIGFTVTAVGIMKRFNREA